MHRRGLRSLSEAKETGVGSGIRPWHHRFRKTHASFQRPVGRTSSSAARTADSGTPESAFNARAVLGTGQETQNSEGERGNGQETDLNFERLLLCNLGATGLARCAVRRLVVVAGVWPRLRCALTLSWLIERPTAHPLPTPTQKNQRALDRGTGCTTGGPMSHQDKVRTVWLPGLAICAPPSGTAPHHHGLAFHPIRRSFQSLPATAPQR